MLSRSSRSCKSPLSNKFLLAAVCSPIRLQLALIYWPSLQNIFHTVALGAVDLVVAFTVAGTLFGAVEMENCSGIHGG